MNYVLMEPGKPLPVMVGDNLFRIASHVQIVLAAEPLREFSLWQYTPHTSTPVQIEPIPKPNAKVKRTAMVVLKMHVTHDGTLDKAPTKKQWHKAAEFLLKHGITPHMYDAETLDTMLKEPETNVTPDSEAVPP